MSDEDRKMDHKVVFEPYDMDTALGTNNSGVLMFSPYLEDTDTVSSVIAGGDSGGSEAPVYNAQDSVLWNNIRDAFRSELVQMYRTLRASNGPWQYNAIEKRFEDHQSKWPEAIFNEDAWLKYIIPLVDPVTVDEETGELIRTDRYLTMLQGSKKEQRKWWLYNRLRYLDSKYDTGNASANIINIRFFNGGVLKLKTAIPMYAAVSFGGGTTPEIKRTEANTEVSFTYTPGTGVTEMETWIHSGNLITDVGDLSVFYPNECDFSKASLLRRLKIGDATAGYSNANLTTINVRNSPLLESIDCRNCPRLNITVNLENSPRLAEAYFDGTTITGLDLADGCAIETLHLPATVTALTLLNLRKLQEFVIPSYANVARLMMSNIDYEVVNPVTVLESIHSNAQVNIQGLYLELDDAEAIGEFFDLLDTMTGVTRERSAVTGEWIYHDAEKAVVSGEVHTFALTGEEMEALNGRYPYVRTTADHISTTLKYYNYDGSVLLESETILDGADGTYTGTPARADDADWRYTFIGWNTQPDKYVADEDATKSVTRNRSVYAAYSRTSIAVLKYYTYDGSELLYSETIIGGGNGVWTGAPARASTAQYSYTFAGWSTQTDSYSADANATKNVATHRSVYAAYTRTVRTYLCRYMNGTTVLQDCGQIAYGSNMPAYSGTTPVKTGVEDPEMYEFTGWNPSNQNITGARDCQPVFIYLGNKTRLWMERNYKDSTYYNSYVTYVKPLAFCEVSNVEFSFPNVESIGMSAFFNTNNISTLYYSKLEYIDQNAFGNVRISNIDLPNVKSIGSYAFVIGSGNNLVFSNLKSVSLPNVRYIGAYAFQKNASLAVLSLPNIEKLDMYAFSSCQSLSDIYLGSKIKTIGIGCFANCFSLTNFSVHSSAHYEISGYYVFDHCSNLSVLNLVGCNKAYAGYGTSAIITNCRSLITLSMNDLTYASSMIVYNCSNLRRAEFSKLSSWYGILISNCANLSEINFPMLGSFNDYIIDNCPNLERIYAGHDMSQPHNIWYGNYYIGLMINGGFSACPKLSALILSTSTSYSWNFYVNLFSGNSVNIYVDDSKVNFYRNAYSSGILSSRFHGISELLGE